MSASTDFRIKQRLVIQFLTQNIATGDESWVPNPENKRQSMEYRHPGSPSVKKFKTVQSAKKFMLTIFWDARGLLYTEFLTKGTTVIFGRYCVQPYHKSSNAYAKSGRKETRFFCITTTQGHIAVHKLRTP